MKLLQGLIAHLSILSDRVVGQRWLVWVAVVIGLVMVLRSGVSLNIDLVTGEAVEPVQESTL